ncbi:MAG TPA: hypothetical protein VM681_04325 [Candidatus Thermoplasmatota archaeon]|nr:hypothetical protein [Candidatus Thermoplasmatota archaeon]
MRAKRRAAWVAAGAIGVTVAFLALVLSPAAAPLALASVDGQPAHRRTIQWYDFTRGAEGSFSVVVPVEAFERARADTLTRARILLGDDAAYAELVNLRSGAIRAVAAELRQVARGDDELFANLALQVAHQTVYRSTFAPRSAVETLVEGAGDCDTFVVLVASILRAGGLPVVLLLYRPQIGLLSFREGHMQVAVGLDEPPRLLPRASAHANYVQHEGTAYYVAETTLRPGFNEEWRTGWRVGQAGAPRGFAGPDVVIPVP